MSFARRTLLVRRRVHNVKQPSLDGLPPIKVCILAQRGDEVLYSILGCEASPVWIRLSTLRQHWRAEHVQLID